LTDTATYPDISTAGRSENGGLHMFVQ